LIGSEIISRPSTIFRTYGVNKGAKNAKNFSCFSFARFAALREKIKIQKNFTTKDTNFRTKKLTTTNQPVHGL